MAEEIKAIVVREGADVVKNIIYTVVGVAGFGAIVGGTLMQLIALI